MRNFLPAIFFLCLLATDVAAQKTKSFKINPGEKVLEKIHFKAPK